MRDVMKAKDAYPTETLAKMWDYKSDIMEKVVGAAGGNDYESHRSLMSMCVRWCPAESFDHALVERIEDAAERLRATVHVIEEDSRYQVAKVIHRMNRQKVRHLGKKKKKW